MIRKKGRPRKHEIPEPSPSRTVMVYFKSPRSEEVRLFATHCNVPGNWTDEMILGRLGIGRHLKVTAETEGRSVVLQHFPA